MKEVDKGKVASRKPSGVLDKEQIIIQVKEELDKEKARKHSIREGKFAAVAQGVGHTYISPFIIALGASNLQIGLLSSLPWILSPLAQLRGSKLQEKEKRKTIVAKYVFLQSLLWFILSIIAILSYIYRPINLTIITIIFYLALVAIGGLAIPSWFSWLGDIVQENSRGTYFAKRNRIAGIAALVSMVLASFFLDYFKTKGLIFIAFSILFFIATLTRAISAYLFTKQYEPEIKYEKGYYFKFSDFIKHIFKDNFGRFTIFISFMKLSVFIAAPFFAVYLLRDLGLSYLWFTAITITSTLVTLISYPLWGRFSDKYGNKELLKIGSILIPLVPIFWMFSKNPIYIILVPQVIAGLGWAAFTLGSTNFIYDIATPQRRGITFAYHNLVIGIGILLGGGIGSLLAQYLPVIGINKILIVFLISGIARIAAMGIFLPTISEPRKVKKIKGSEVKAILNEIRPLHLPGLTHFVPHFNHHRIVKK